MNKNSTSQKNLHEQRKDYCCSYLIRNIRLLLIGSFILLSVIAPAVEVPIVYTVPKDGQVSLAIYNSSGELVRTILKGAKRKAGTYTEIWDGRDRYGVALPAGAYKYKILVNQGLLCEFVTMVGGTVGHPSEYAPGNHNPPMSAVADGSYIYRCAGEVEGAPMAAKNRLSDGIELWGAHHWGSEYGRTGAAACLIGDRLYALLFNGRLFGYSATTGNLFTGGNFSPAPWDFTWTGGGSGPTTGMYATGMDMDADVSSNMLVVSYRAANAVRWFSGANGSAVDVATGITAPMGVACAANGTVYVISQGAVSRLTRTNKTPVQVIPASALQSPWRITVDAGSGDILVAENSSLVINDSWTPSLSNPHHQVKRFSSSGQLLNTYGRADGRQDGAYVSTDFYHISDISADGQGGFVVTEPFTPPRRVAHFRKDGSLIKEYFGGQHWGVQAAPEPDDGRYVWFGTNPGGIVRARIDFSNKTWTILETYTRTLQASGIFKDASLTPRCVKRGGKLYITTSPNAWGGHWWMALYDPANKKLRLTNFSNYRVSNGFWNDLNDNGLVDAGESISGVAGGYVEPETMRILTTENATGYYQGPVYKPTGFTAGGTPIYSGSGAGRDGDLPKLSEWDRTVTPADVRKGEDGSTYGIVGGWGIAGGMVETYGYWYFNLNVSGERLIKWDASGKKLWSVGHHSSYADKQEGTTVNARAIVGFGPNGTIIWGESSDEEVAGAVVYSPDGLYVGELFRKTDGSPYEYFAFRQGVETPHGETWIDKTTNDMYIYLTSTSGGAPVYRIKGWNDWHTAECSLTLPSASSPLAANGTGLKAEYFDNLNMTGNPVLTRTDPIVMARWEDNPAGPGVPNDNFSVRWTGQVEAIYSDETIFGLEGDDNWAGGGKPNWYRLYVDGKLILTRTGLTPGQSNTPNIGLASIQLQPGKKYDIKLEAGFATGKASIKLVWESRATDRRHILARYLHPTGYTGATKTSGGLLARWRFDETSGTTASDASGNNYTMQLGGITWANPGLQNNAVIFSNTSQAGQAMVNASETAHSVSLWFMTSSDGGIFTCSNAGGTHDRDIWIEGGELKARVNGSIAEMLMASGLKVNDGQWHHVAHILGGEAGVHRLYVDGVLRAVGNTPASAFTSQDRIRLGEVPGITVSKFNGVIDECMIYNTAISPDAVSELFRSQSLARIYFEGPDEPLTLVSGDVTFGPGRVGNAATINGTGATAAYMLIDNRELNLPVTDYSVAFWLRTTSANTLILNAKRLSPYNNRSDGHIVKLENGQVNFDGLVSSAKVNDGTWHHIGTIYDPKDGAKLYVDGVLAASDPAKLRRNNQSNLLGLVIGRDRYTYSDNYHNAPFTIDDLRMITRSLSATEISKLATETKVNVTSVTLNPSAITVDMNCTQQLTATVAPSTVINKNVSWTSGNPSVATVDAFGNVSGVSAGTAVITVTTQDGNKTATATVTVNKANTVLTTQLPVTCGNEHHLELGMKFRSGEAGKITGIRFYKVPGETEAHTGRIWSSTGTQLASVTFSNETASGWQCATLSTALNISANTTYVVSVNSNHMYPATLNGLQSAISNGPLSSIADNANGVFNTTAGSFPNSSSNNTNYFRDVTFESGVTGIVEGNGNGKTLSIYPNPASEQTVIRYTVSQGQQVNIGLYDLMGREVMPVVNEKQSSGDHQVSINTSTLLKGIYLLKVTMKEEQMIEKLIIE